MRSSIILLGCLFFIGCNDDTVVPPGNTNVSAGDVLVLNEGGFQKGNASIGLYNLATNAYTSNLYKNNNGTVIGDVLQTLVSLNGTYWAVVNNSGKIVVLDSTDMAVKFEITGFKSPRNVEFNENKTKAFVSDLYANEIAVVNTTTYKIDQFIPLDGWTDQMAIVGELLYVANRERPYVFVVDATSNKVVDSIQVANNPNSLLRINDNVLAVLCEGRLGSADLAKFQVIQLDTRKVTKEFSFDAGVKPSLLRKSPTTGNIYCAFKGIHYIHPADYTYQGKTIDLPEANIYGFDIDPSNGNFFVSDAKDYVKKSEVSVYVSGSTLKQQFTAGVICNGFVFR